MASITEKTEDIAVVESQKVEIDETSESYRKLTRRVLWKFDTHVLPPLAFVRVRSFFIDSKNP